jgi:hypothetical protein
MKDLYLDHEQFVYHFWLEFMVNETVVVEEQQETNESTMLI